MKMDTLTDKMGCITILSIKVFVEKIKCAVHKFDDIDGTCKQSLHGVQLSQGMGQVILFCIFIP